MPLLSNGADFVPSQPWQMLFQQPRALDMTPNPAYDQAMGYDIKPGDDEGTAFGKSLQSMLSRTTPEGQNMMNELAKGRLANQLQIQLKQQQYQLAQQYPTYQHFVSTGLGTVLAMDELGNSKLLGQENPTLVAMKQAELAKTQAEAGAAGFKASPEYQKAELGSLQAEANYKNAMPAMEQAKIGLMQKQGDRAEAAARASGFARMPIPDYGKELNNALEEAGIPKTPSAQAQMFGEDPAIAAKRQQAVSKAQQSYQQKLQMYQQARAASGLAAPQDPSAQLQSILSGGFGE